MWLLSRDEIPFGAGDRQFKLQRGLGYDTKIGKAMDGELPPCFKRKGWLCRFVERRNSFESAVVLDMATLVPPVSAGRRRRLTPNVRQP